ncbi:MAG: amidohydrolase family protein [Alphaproteobacteria bacterium]
MATVIDIHTHAFGQAYLDLLGESGAPDYGTRRMPDGREYLVEKGVPAVALRPEAFDYEAKIHQMDQFGIDLAIISLSSPGVFWGGEAISSKAAVLVNDSQAAAQTAYPDRIRWLATLPWEYPDLAVAELDRAVKQGAVGVMVMATIGGRHLVDPLFEPVWNAIDRHALPVLVHPTAPFGAKEAEFSRERILMPGVGFMFDTTLCIARMILDGFLDRHTRLKLIAAHGGGFLPYVAGRIDMLFDRETLIEGNIDRPPSRYLEDIWFDSVVYNPGALDLCIETSGPGNVMFGTDLPMSADVEKLYAVVDRLPADQVKAIKAGTARRLFGL